MKLPQWANGIKSMLQSPDGDISFKRVIGVIGALSLITALFVVVFVENVQNPPSELVDAIEWITMASIGGSAAEKFKGTASKVIKKDEEPEV